MNSLLARIPGIERFKDAIRAARILLPGRDQLLKEQFLQCKTPGDFFDFASDVFPSCQIKSEITSLLNLATEKKPLVVGEIGTSAGGTHFLLANAIPGVEQMIGLDLYVKNTALLRHFSHSGTTFYFRNAPSCSPKTIDAVQKELNGRMFDLLFIDGDHTYKGVRDDFVCYRPYVRPGGLIAFHDIIPDYQTRYGKFTGRWAGDVPRFWQEIKNCFPEHWEFVNDPEQDGFGIGVISNNPDITFQG